LNLNDPLSRVTPQQAAQAAFVAVDRLQDLHPAHQVAGAAMLFAMVCRRFDVDPRELLMQTDRRLADALRANANDKPGDIVRALRMYLKENV